MTQTEKATLTELLVLMVEQHTASESQLKYSGVDAFRKHPAYAYLVEELILKLDGDGELLKAVTAAQEVTKKEVDEELLSRYIWRHQLEAETAAHA